MRFAYEAQLLSRSLTMTKDELAEKLQHLDPGATLSVEAGELARMFGADALTDDVVHAVEAFALERRCSFSHHEHGRVSPCFEKDDVF